MEGFELLPMFYEQPSRYYRSGNKRKKVGEKIGSVILKGETDNLPQ